MGLVLVPVEQLVQILYYLLLHSKCVPGCVNGDLGLVSGDPGCVSGVLGCVSDVPRCVSGVPGYVNGVPGWDWTGTVSNFASAVAEDEEGGRGVGQWAG